MCWMLAKQKVLLACSSSELSVLELQSLSPYNTDKKEREMDIPTLDELDPALIKMLGVVWYGENIQPVLPAIRREVLFLYWLTGTR